MRMTDGHYATAKHLEGTTAGEASTHGVTGQAGPRFAIADASTVGFDADAGILALAVTAHPDFDNTPLFDENGDGDPGIAIESCSAPTTLAAPAR